MLIVQVFVHVRPEAVDAFRAATIENATSRMQETGVARFDVLQSADDSTWFTLIEAYLSDEAPATHKATPHYARWRDVVEPMLAEPRSSVKYRDVHYRL